MRPEREGGGRSKNQRSCLGTTNDGLEKVEDSVAIKVDKKFEEAKLHLATKEDLANTKNDIIKWVFAFFVTLMLAIVGLYFRN